MLGITSIIKNSTVNTNPVNIFADATFPQPFFVVNTKELVLSYHSPANKNDKTIAKNKAITLPKSATILARSSDHPSTHPYPLPEWSTDDEPQ